MHIPALQPGCPWYKLSSLGLPNVKWCEATRCSWITEPANTWSNLAYIIAGIIIFMMLKPENRKTSKWFGATLIFVGFSSFVYHMSYTLEKSPQEPPGRRIATIDVGGGNEPRLPIRGC